MTSEIRYADHKAMIFKLAYTYNLTTPFGLETLVSEANLIFAECLLKFSSGNAKFSTYLYLRITGHFKNMVRLQNLVVKNQINCIEYGMDEQDAEVYVAAAKRKSPETLLIKQDCYQKLSKEARDVVDIILNGPREVLEMLSSPVHKVFNKKKVWSYLSCNLGFDRATEVKEELQDFVANF